MCIFKLTGKQISVGFVVFWLVFGAPARAEDHRQPHVLLMVADDLRADVMSVYGGPVPTPNLAQLASRGCLWLRATCGYPICHVSRTEILTGRYMVAEASAGSVIPFQPDWKLWPQQMRDAGWQTVYVGKWHAEGTPWNRGYAQTSALYSGGGSPGSGLTLQLSATGRDVTGYKNWTFKTNENLPLLDYGVGLTPDTDALIADGAIQALRQVRGQSMFLHVNFTAPHDPLHWPRGYEKSRPDDELRLPQNFRSEHPFDHGNLHGRDERILPAPRTAADVSRERAVYYALVENLDGQVGRILHALEETGGLESTIVIFTSDQGLALGSHGLMGKQNQYEHTAGVPLILSGPGIPAKQRLAAQCGLRDLYPTVCDLVALPIPQTVQGKSLLPALQLERREVHDAIFGYFTDTQRMIRTADGWKLIEYPKAGQTQLFNVSEDPEELHNLAEQTEHQSRLLRMRQRLRSWLNERQDPAPGL